jgi:hypothetical protein
MKFLTTLVILQLLLTLVLIGVFLDREPEQPDPLVEATPAEPAAEKGEPTPPEPEIAIAGEDRLRQIVREEIAILLGALSTTKSQPGERSAEATSAAEYSRRLDLAQQQLEFYIEKGEISPQEMAELQASIARLDPQSRREMLNLLTQALNSGELDGQF